MKRLIFVLAISSLYLGGCQAGTQQAQEPNQTKPETSEVTSSRTDEKESSNADSSSKPNEQGNEDVDTTKYENIKVSVTDAFDIYMDKYPNAKINEIELESKHDTFEYEIEGYEGDTEYEISIDAFTKEILDEDTDKESDESGEIKREDLDKVDQYVKETLDDAGSDFWVDEWELKVKSDYTKFKIKVKNDNDDKLKYKYDFETGELIKKD